MSHQHRVAMTFKYSLLTTVHCNDPSSPANSHDFFGYLLRRNAQTIHKLLSSLGRIPRDLTEIAQPSTYLAFCSSVLQNRFFRVASSPLPVSNSISCRAQNVMQETPQEPAGVSVRQDRDVSDIAENLRRSRFQPWFRMRVSTLPFAGDNRLRHAVA